MSTQTLSATNELINRFKNYNPSELYFNHEDCSVIFEALVENKSTHGDPTDAVALLAYLASENIKTKQEYLNFRKFMCDYQNQVIEFNFSECGDNDWWCALSDEEREELPSAVLA
jgi:hypothetical protein